MQHWTLKRAYFLISMYGSIVHDHLCDTRLPTFETLSFLLMIFLQPVVSHLHDLSIFVLDNPFFLFEGTMSIHQVTWNAQECGILHFNKLSCFKCERECSHYFLKARPHCKLPSQIGGAARPSGLMSVNLARRLVSSTI